ncbi:MAG TPA: class I SAM-dependent methyltransferase [Vicinamibacterales bacterium]|nr:class I SAM-dependent methyltransferase [Vicinamibacterales bacterium]
MNSSAGKSVDFTGDTEVPGTLVSREAASMAVSRYEVARRLATGRRVLEIACGSGQGLGYVARSAARIVGGDITFGLLSRARAHYRSAVPLVHFDAHALPFLTGTFDVIQLHEAIYYMRSPEDVFHECQRVLSPDGVLIVSSINPAWRDFNPSVRASAYLRAEDLQRMLGRAFRVVDIRFGFAAPVDAPRTIMISAVKRAAVRLRLIPRTMRGKTLLKRVFLGPLMPVPSELTPDIAPIDEPRSVPLAEATRYRIIYAVAHR